ncbi:MAG: LysR family transcriptional regulator [Tagaea sp.]|nr:LysR family transcriptional regulator [Tagaea sp.]
MNVEIAHLRAFLAVADLGGFGRAASSLKISQPALSARIRDLERKTGVTLFDRTTRRVELSAAGREFLPQARKLLGDLEAALRGLGDLAQRKRGHVAIACAPLLAQVLLPDLVAKFVRRYPGIEVSLIDVPTDRIVEKVRSGEADLGVGTFAESEAGLARTKLFGDALMLFEPRARKSRRGAATWAEIADLPLIALTRESGLRALVERGFAALDREVRPVFEVAQVATVLALVQAGLGIAVLPAIARTIADDRRVAMRALVQPRITREISLIRSDSRAPTPAALAFAELARQT